MDMRRRPRQAHPRPTQARHRAGQRHVRPPSKAALCVSYMWQRHVRPPSKAATQGLETPMIRAKTRKAAI